MSNGSYPESEVSWILMRFIAHFLRCMECALPNLQRSLPHTSHLVLLHDANHMMDLCSDLQNVPSVYILTKSVITYLVWGQGHRHKLFIPLEHRLPLVLPPIGMTENTLAR